MIHVVREPSGRILEFASLNTVLQLLNRLGEKPTTVLVIRDGELLTPDRRLRRGDTVTVRGVRSSG